MLKQGVQMRAGSVFLLGPKGPDMQRGYRAERRIEITRKYHNLIRPMLKNQTFGVKPPLGKDAGLRSAMRRVEP